MPIYHCHTTCYFQSRLWEVGQKINVPDGAPLLPSIVEHFSLNTPEAAEKIPVMGHLDGEDDLDKPMNTFSEIQADQDAKEKKILAGKVHQPQAEKDYVKKK